MPTTTPVRLNRQQIFIYPCVFFTLRSVRARRVWTDGRADSWGRCVVAATVASWGRWLDVREVAQRRGARSSPLVVRVLWMLADFSLTM